MQKILITFVVVPTFMYASYNPFFSDNKPPSALQTRQKAVYKTPIKQYIPRQVSRKSIKMSYFGFIESNKGVFALVKYNGKNIVIHTNDFLYNDEKRFKIKKITSNYILVKDRRGNVESVYFSSAKQEQNQ
jgi:Tfp pilus assembly protein PilP